MFQTDVDMYNLGMPRRIFSEWPVVEKSENFPLNPTYFHPGSVTLAGMIHQSMGVPPGRMRVLGAWALVLVVEGGGTYYQKPNVRLPVTKGSMILVHPRRAHAYGPEPGGRWDEIYLVFRGDVFNAWEQALEPLQAVAQMREVPGLFKTMRHAATAADPATAMVLVQQVLAEFLKHSRAASPLVRPHWIDEAKHSFVDSNGQITPRKVARQLGIAYENFRKAFTRHTGISPGRFASGIVAEHAGHLLRHTDLPLREVARQLGFCDEFHFSKRFKQTTGMTPSMFREVANTGKLACVKSV
jgi:AraC-like DNA-binding protein